MELPDPPSFDWIPVLVGLFSLLGVAIGHLLSMLSAWFARKRQRREMLLSKLDLLTSEVQTIVHWQLQCYQTQNLTLMQSLHPSLPCCRIGALAALYFPQLEQPVARYTEALQSYYNWSVQQVPNFSKDGTFPHPLLWCLHLHDPDTAKRHTDEIQSRQNELATAVALEAKRLLN